MRMSPDCQCAVRAGERPHQHPGPSAVGNRAPGPCFSVPLFSLIMGHVTKHHTTTYFPGQGQSSAAQSTVVVQLPLPFLMNSNGSFILDFKESVTEPNIPYSWASWASEKTISSPGGQLVWLTRQLTNFCHVEMPQQNQGHCNSDHTRVSNK